MLTDLGAELYGILIMRLAKEGPISWAVERGDMKRTDGLSIGEMLPVPPAPLQHSPV